MNIPFGFNWSSHVATSLTLVIMSCWVWSRFISFVSSRSSSSSSQNPQLVHQSGWNVTLHTQHLFDSFNITPRQNGWKVCLQEVTTTCMQWNPWLQNPHGFTMIKVLPLSSNVSSKCTMGLGLKAMALLIFILFH